MIGVDIIYAFPISIGLFIVLFLLMLGTAHDTFRQVKRGHKEIRTRLCELHDLISTLTRTSSHKIYNIECTMHDLNTQFSKLEKLFNTPSVPVKLKFKEMVADDQNRNFINAPLIEISTDELTETQLATKIIWEGFQYLLENPHLKINQTNLKEVMDDYKKWMAKSAE